MVFQFFQFITWYAMKTIARVFFDFQIIGRENIKFIKPGGAIIAANHEGGFDPFFIGVALPRVYHQNKKALRFLTYYKFVTRKWYGPIISLLGAYPVYPGNGDIEKSTKKTVELLKNKKHDVLIFPIGKQKPEIIPENAKQGVAYIAQKLNSQITPVLLKGGYRIKWKDLFKRRKIIVVFGQPFYYQDYVRTGEQPIDVAIRIMQDVKKMEKQLPGTQEADEKVADQELILHT